MRVQLKTDMYDIYLLNTRVFIQTLLSIVC